MLVNEKAKALIKQYEGKRLRAYRCAAGVLTIGYGHTSAAGSPRVTPGMSITEAEADAIFNRDIERFAAKVESLLKVDVGENQFGAMVSLAYNIGIGAFSKSSVLRFVNKKRFDDAADAFALWNKAGGKVLPGLVRRRAAETALFREDDAADVADAVEPIARIPDEPVGKKMTVSSTNIAAATAAAAGVSASIKEVASNTSDLLSGGNMLMFALAAVVVAGAAWVIKERWAKARDWAV